MSLSARQGLIKCQGLSASELSEIKQLAEICNQHDGLDLKLNWSILSQRPADQLNDFLYYSEGQLVGFLALFSFSAQEGEISGMVHPVQRQQGIFRALFDAACQEARSRGLPRLLLIVEAASPGGQAFARHLPVTYDHSEYKMVLEEQRLPATLNPPLQFRAAAPQDIPALSRIAAQAFGLPQDEADWYSERDLTQANRRYYVGEIDGVIIGKIDVILSEDAALILGFAVSPQYQGWGYGRQMLTRTVREMLDSGARNIWLEVSMENSHALSLYQSCGFKEVGRYDYYRLEIHS